MFTTFETFANHCTLWFLVNGTFVPANLDLPKAPKDLGCAALELLAAGAPNEVGEPGAQAAADVYNQILGPVLGGTCDIKDYIVPASADYVYPGENTNAGSGSGITHQGEFDDQTHKPTGESAGDPIKMRKRSAWKA